MGAGTALFHITVFLFYSFVIYFLHFGNPNKPKDPVDNALKIMALFSGRFLTNWTYTLQAVYFLLCVVNHLLCVLSAKKLKEKLTTFLDYIFTSVATPMALMVSIVFWALYIYDRELIFPKVIDQVMPVYINHSIHTFNSMIAIVDMYLVNHKFSSFGKALNGILAYLLLYSVCIFGTYIQTGYWLYPILKELDWPQRFMFTIAVLLFSILMYGLTKLIHNIIWGSVVQTVPKKSTKSKHK